MPPVPQKDRLQLIKKLAEAQKKKKAKETGWGRRTPPFALVLESPIDAVPQGNYDSLNHAAQHVANMDQGTLEDADLILTELATEKRWIWKGRRWRRTE